MSDEEVRWHVRIAPGEVKLLTLEQVDDLYRLDMIDGDTLLREDGTKDWIPLRVVAGLDEEEAAPAPPPASSVRPAPAALGSAPPPISNPPPAPLPVSSAPAPVTATPPPVRSAPPPPPAPLPPPTELVPSSPAPFVHSPSFVPPAPSERRPSAPPPSASPPSFTPPPPSVRPPPPSSRPVPSAPPPSFAPPEMAALSVPPAPPSLAAGASRAETLLIALAVVLGLLVVLNRNGALAALFASAGQGATYAGIEASLGGPSFGTPRAVDALMAKTVAPASSAPAR